MCEVGDRISTATKSTTDTDRLSHRSPHARVIIGGSELCLCEIDRKYENRASVAGLHDGLGPQRWLGQALAAGRSVTARMIGFALNKLKKIQNKNEC